MNANFIIMIIGVSLMIFGIFRFTIYKSRFIKTINVLGFEISPEAASIIIFTVGLTFLLLFLINELQPLFYKGREMQKAVYN